RPPYLCQLRIDELFVRAEHVSSLPPGWRQSRITRSSREGGVFSHRLHGLVHPGKRKSEILEVSKSNESCISSPEIPKYRIALRGRAFCNFGFSGLEMQDSFDFEISNISNFRFCGMSCTFKETNM